MQAKFINRLIKLLPLLVVVVVVVVLAFQNIDLKTTYSGWDNIHAEFDLVRYTRQVFFGAWLEHQSLGAPAAQGHLSEVTRLPILAVLLLFLPENLVRYAFIFSMLLIGGVGMYWYLLNVWLKRSSETLKPWLASLGGVFYLLHILTLQQFYISFEMFTIQFAFLPFLLLSIHTLFKKIELRTIIIFLLVQFLLAPSAHTPTIFYLAAVFSVGYAALLAWSKRGFGAALQLGLLVGGLTFFANAHWIIPNLYYSIHDSRYVQESRDNILFAPESVWSIREAGTLANLTSGMQYIFSWKDYSFEKKTYDFIFNEWLIHLAKPSVLFLLRLFGTLTLVGGLTVALDQKLGAKRWAVLGLYVFCLLFIWIDLFPTSVVLDKLYQIGAFREAFRNPFTKLSVLYSFVSILLFVQVIAVIAEWLWSRSRFRSLIRPLTFGLIFSLIIAIGYTAWPSFQGHFISEKLKVIYPPVYKDMFAYLKTRDSDLRILQLPQTTHAGWELYDWQFIRPGNGYQGMGFYPWGFPQAFLNRDSDRWIETSDFFYFELKAALDTRSSDRLREVLAKYRVDLIIIDTTKIDSSNAGSHAADAALIGTIGYVPVWQKDFITIYEKTTVDAVQSFFVPPQVAFAAAATSRVRRDEVYHSMGSYVLTEATDAAVLFPFARLQQREITGVEQTSETTTIGTAIPQGSYTAQLPGWGESFYTTPVAIHYEGTQISLQFPELQLIADTTVTVPKIADFSFTTKAQYGSVLLAFNNVGVPINQGETVYPVLELAVDSSVLISYVEKPTQPKFLPSGELDSSPLQFISAPTLEPDWKALQQPLSFDVSQVNQLKAKTTFPVKILDLLQNPSINCLNLKTGKIETKSVGVGVRYEADEFAVNCNGYTFSDASSATDYLLRIQGKNYQGRATKLFINYADSNVIPEDYLIQQPVFDSFLTLSKATNDPRSTFFINWETRSFGKKSVNELTGMQLAVFPLNQVSQLRLQRTDRQTRAVNSARLISVQRYGDVFYAADYGCSGRDCYLGFDQSYDDGWVGVLLPQLRVANHLRLNNWANAWEVPQGGGTLVVFYIPEIVSLGCMGVLFSGFTWLVVTLWHKRSRESFVSQPHPTTAKLRQRFLGHS